MKIGFIRSPKEIDILNTLAATLTDTRNNWETFILIHRLQQVSRIIAHSFLRASPPREYDSTLEFSFLTPSTRVVNLKS